MRHGVWTAALATALVVGCGGGAATTGSAGTPAPTLGPTAAVPPAPTAALTAAASLLAGLVGYRVVNASTSPVDVYLRSQGLVHAVRAVGALAPGAVTADLFPPDPGEVVVLAAGAGDPACVADCGFRAESSTNTGEGDRRLLVVRDANSTEFWANPKPASVGVVANALPPGDPAGPLVMIEAGGVADATFGLQVAWSGASGCATARDAAGLLLGGTNVLAYPMDPAGGAFTLYAGSDATCSKAPIGGPISVSAAAAGSRTFATVWGASPGLAWAVLPLP